MALCRTVLAVCILMFSALSAQDNGAARLNGDWVGGFMTLSGPRVFVFAFRPEGGSFTGFAQKAIGSQKFPFSEPSVTGDTFAFTLNTGRIKGRIISPTALELTLHWNPRDGEKTFTIKKTPGFTDDIATQVAGVDRSSMGVYRTLATLAIEAAKRKNMDEACKFAVLLERTWDQGETELQKNDRPTWKQIDDALDGLLFPIVYYKYFPPDPASLETLYKTFLDKLRLADKAIE